MTSTDGLTTQGLSGSTQVPRSTQSIRHHAVAALALLGPFVLCHPSHLIIDNSLARSIAINSALFVAPGLPIVGVLLTIRLLSRWHLLGALAASFVVFGLGVLAVSLAGQSLTPGLLWNFTFGVTAVALIANWYVGGSATWGLPRARSKLLIAVPVFAVAYLLFFWGATRVVPAQSDHDLDLQGTAHALLTRLTPSYETPRGMNYLAHPPLLHAYVAGSFLYFNRLDDLQAFDPASEQALPPEQHWPHHLQSPFFVETRTPNIFLGAMTVALLAVWLSSITGAWVAVLLAAAYATFPELFSRFSYGGYFAISNFFALQIVLAIAGTNAGRENGRRLTGILVGVLSAWANHKLVLLPLSLAIWGALTSPNWRNVRASAGRVFHPVVVGFLLGSVSFWAYGLWVDPTDFLNDHIRHHVVDRILSENRRAMDLSVYLSFLGLWSEFWRDTSYLLLPAGALALLRLVIQHPTATHDPIRDDPFGGGFRGLPGFLLIWTAVAGAAFSVIDWRQTKHLAEILVLAPVIAAALTMKSQGPLRRLMIGVFVVMLCWNLLVLNDVAADFDSLVKHPEW